MLFNPVEKEVYGCNKCDHVCHCSSTSSQSNVNICDTGNQLLKKSSPEVINSQTSLVCRFDVTEQKMFYT